MRQFYRFFPLPILMMILTVYPMPAAASAPETQISENPACQAEFISSRPENAGDPARGKRDPGQHSAKCAASVQTDVYSSGSTDVPDTGAAEQYRLPVLMYHSILPDVRYAGTYVLPPEDLENDLRLLSEKGYETVTPADLLSYADEGKPLPGKPVMLTFDDGYYNNCVYLPPLLQKYGMRAALFPVGSFVQTYSENGERSVYYAMAGWDELRELEKSGLIELGSHSWALHSLSPRRGAGRLPGESDAAYQAVLSADLSRMQEAMTARCGVTPRCFAYPFGVLDRAADPVLRALGFRITLTCEERINRITRDPESLRLLGRFNRPYGIRSEDFFSKLEII